MKPYVKFRALFFICTLINLGLYKRTDAKRFLTEWKQEAPEFICFSLLLEWDFDLLFLVQDVYHILEGFI